MRRRLLALIALGLAAACSYSLDLPSCRVTCSATSDCPSDTTCSSGFCQRGSVDQCAADAAASIGGSTGTGGSTSTGGAPPSGGSTGTGGVSATGGSMGTGGGPATGGTTGTGGAPATGGSMATGGMPGPPDGGGAGCSGGCGMGTICCMAPWNCKGTCVPDCRPTGTCQQTDVCNTQTGLCQPDCRRTSGNCPPGSGLTCDTGTGVCR